MILARKFNRKNGNLTLEKGNLIEDLGKHWCGRFNMLLEMRADSLVHSLFAFHEIQ
jgi:hypothetical protein